VAIYASAMTLASFVLLRFLTLSVGLRRDGQRWSTILLAFATHLGLGWTFSSSWVACLWDRRARFVRTDKFIGQLVPWQLRWMAVELGTGTLLVLACTILAFGDLVAGPAAALAFAAIRFAILWVWHQARATHELTAHQSNHASDSEQASAA
jgi:hypothetical protein